MSETEISDLIANKLGVYIEASRKADAKVLRWQKQMGPGDCFKQIASNDLEIFGEVLTQELYSNWRKCLCYSLIYPKGKVCFIHVVLMKERIDRKTFELIRDSFSKAY